MNTHMKWSLAYARLTRLRFSLFERSMLIDWNYAGAVTTLNADTIIIYIKNSLSHKEKVATLAHEYGHLLSYRSGKYKRLKHVAKEAKANRTALKIAKSVGMSEFEYKRIYKRLTGKTAEF